MELKRQFFTHHCKSFSNRIRIGTSEILSLELIGKKQREAKQTN